jgi:hypothetical protein
MSERLNTPTTRGLSPPAEGLVEHVTGTSKTNVQRRAHWKSYRTSQLSNLHTWPEFECDEVARHTLSVSDSS